MDLTWRIAAAMVAVTLACAGCATSGPGLAAPSVTWSSSATAAGGALSPASGSSGGASSSSGDSPGASQTPAALPLAGKTIGIDPGHNGGNFDDFAYINTMIWNGRAEETCDTTGT